MATSTADRDRRRRGDEALRSLRSHIENATAQLNRHINSKGIQVEDLVQSKPVRTQTHRRSICDKSVNMPEVSLATIFEPRPRTIIPPSTQAEASSSGDSLDPKLVLHDTVSHLNISSHLRNTDYLGINLHPLQAHSPPVKSKEEECCPERSSPKPLLSKMKDWIARSGPSRP